MNEEVSTKPAFSERRWQGLAKRNCVANILHGRACTAFQSL